MVAVDNGSTDKTINIFRTYLNLLDGWPGWFQAAAPR
jgi:glycosyltransferase involved in cell wall biosynthesis